MVDLPTMTELRARGENQRFLDDLGYIVDGLQDELLEVKRSRYVLALCAQTSSSH